MFQFVNLMLPSNLCIRMLGQLGGKIRKEVRNKDAWSVRSQDVFSLSVAKSLRVRLSCFLIRQASPMWFSLERVGP